MPKSRPIFFALNFSLLLLLAFATVEPSPAQAQSGECGIFGEPILITKSPAKVPAKTTPMQRNTLSPQTGGLWVQESTSAPWGARSGQSCVVFNDQIWLLGGYSSDKYNADVWSSRDGSQWTRVTSSAEWGPRSAQASVVFKGKIWVIAGFNGGYKNDVWSSSDGKSWTHVANAPFSKRSLMAAVVFNDRIWIFGGVGELNSLGMRLKNDVWSSSDGKSWTRDVHSANWASRAGHTAVVLNNKIWIMGGSGETALLNDVWSSTDCKKWVLSTSSAGWAARQYHASFTLENIMWVIGGFAGLSTSGYIHYNDVWYSANGVNWFVANSAAPWGVRSACTAAPFNGKIWLLGGYDGSFRGGSSLKDIWSSNYLVKNGVRTWQAYP